MDLVPTGTRIGSIKMERVPELLSSNEAKLKNWNLNLNEVREALIYMVIVDELPFKHVAKTSVRHLMSIAWPRFHMPSRTTVARNYYQHYLNERAKLKETFRTSYQRVCVTTNTWTSNQRINYMCITTHYIDKD